MNEADLLQLIKKNDNQSFEIILSNYRYMIHHIITRNETYYTTFEISKDDLFQEGSIALYEACIKYNPKSNAKFSTFAYLLISRRIKKKINEYFKKIQHESFSIDAVEDPDYLDYNTYSYKPYDYIDYVNKKEKIESFIKKLSPLEKQIISLREANLSYQDIADILHIKKKQVDNKLHYMKIKYLKDKS